MSWQEGKDSASFFVVVLSIAIQTFVRLTWNYIKEMYCLASNVKGCYNINHNDTIDNDVARNTSKLIH